jgi:chemotaxis protein histidine kinase CheA
MATETEIQIEEPKFDAAEFIKARNEGRPMVIPEEKKAEEAPKEEAKAPVVAKVEAEDEKPEAGHLSRRERRAARAQAEELGRLRERAEHLQRQVDALMTAGSTKKAASEDPEPMRTDFATNEEFQRAVSKWDARQETAETLKKQTEKAQNDANQAQYLALVGEMDAKTAEDRKQLADWDEVLEIAHDLGDSLTVPPGSALEKLIQISDERARILYHFVKHPDQFKALVDLGDGPLLVRNFGRLENKVETLYPFTQKDPPVVQAAEDKTSKERTAHPAEAKPAGRNIAERDALKPRPSNEVSARGGSAPPDEPAVGSAAWMARRNQAQFGK